MSRSTYVKKSPIHGRGVFARRRLAKGVFLGRYHGNTTRRNGRYVLWVLQDDGEHIGINGRNGLRFLNHSRRPNAEFVGAELFTTRAVHADEEITIDYGPDWADTN